MLFLRAAIISAGFRARLDSERIRRGVRSGIAITCYADAPNIRATMASVAERTRLCKSLEQLVEGLKAHTPVSSHRAVVADVRREMASHVVLRLEHPRT